MSLILWQTVAEGSTGAQAVAHRDVTGEVKTYCSVILNFERSENVLRRFPGITGSIDGPPDHQPIRARLKRLGWRESSSLVIGFFSAGPNARRDQLNVSRNQLAQSRDFQGRADQPAQLGLYGERGEAFHLFGDV